MQIDVLEIYKIGVAIVGIIAFIIAVYKIYDKINDRLDAIERRLDDDEKKHEADVKALIEHHNEDVEKLKNDIDNIREETCMIIEGLQACLDGLIQLHCNGEVPTTKDKLDKYLNTIAHYIIIFIFIFFLINLSSLKD